MSPELVGAKKFAVDMASYILIDRGEIAAGESAVNMQQRSVFQRQNWAPLQCCGPPLDYCVRASLAQIDTEMAEKYAN